MLPIYMNRRLAAKYVREAWGMRCAEKWLAKLVVTGGGPRYWKNGRSVLYRRDALDAWVARRVSGPWTSSNNLDAESTRNGPPISYLRAGEGLPFVDAGTGSAEKPKLPNEIRKLTPAIGLVCVEAAGMVLPFHSKLKGPNHA